MRRCASLPHLASPKGEGFHDLPPAGENLSVRQPLRRGADQDFAFAGVVGGADDAFVFHAFDQ